MCETKPTARLWRGQTGSGTSVLRPAALDPRGPIVQNEANSVPDRLGELWNSAKQTQFAAGDRKGKCFAEKELWLILHATEAGKTNPILPGVAIVRHRLDAPLRETNPIPGSAGRDGATGARGGRQIVQNKAKLAQNGESGGPARRGGGNGAKRSQFHDCGLRIGDKATAERPRLATLASEELPEDEMRKTNPICQPPPWDRRDRSRETKPICSRQANVGRGGGVAGIALLSPATIITPSSCGAGRGGGYIGWRPLWI
jgi:hypothetical protein